MPLYAGKVLVVDDVQSIRMAVREHLSKEFDVVDVPSASEALRICEEEKIDLLISDIKMPGMSGIELIRTLREKYSYMHYVLMTAYNVDDYVRLAREEGIYHIIPKSVFMDLDFFSSLARKLLSGDYFGIDHYFPNTHKEELHLSDIHKMYKILPEVALKIDTYYHCRIATSEESQMVCDRVGELLLAHQALTTVPQVLEELCTNALKHSKKNEIFSLYFGILRERAVIAVVDHDGSLDKEQILFHIERQVTLDTAGLPIGLGDLHGRGLHITREQCEHLIFNIDPGHRTEVIGVLRPHQKGYNHAISIFQK